MIRITNESQPLGEVTQLKNEVVHQTRFRVHQLEDQIRTGQLEDNFMHKFEQARFDAATADSRIIAWKRTRIEGIPFIGTVVFNRR